MDYAPLSPPPPSQTDNLIAEDIDAYLQAHQHKSLLRFITCRLWWMMANRP